MLHEHLGPDAERKLLLRHFGITDQTVKHLKTQDPDEAQWRIDHEAKMMVGWSRRRYEFMLSQVFDGAPPLPGPSRQVVTLHTRIDQGISGERMG